MKQYPDNYFDCCISDVPYKIATGGCRIEEQTNDVSGIFNRRTNNRLKDKWLKQSTDDPDNDILIKSGKLFEHADIKFSEWLSEVYRVLKDGTHCYLMVNSRNLKELMTEAKKAGFKFLNLLVWVKNNATPNKFYMQKCEFVLLLRKGYAKSIKNMGMGNVFAIPNIIGNKYHPTEKPVELMQIFVEQSTEPNDIILEPFCGAGATVLACDLTGRRFVAAELEECFCKITQQRLQGQAVRKNAIHDERQQSLFGGCSDA
jgi:site-specific DNA-methyltransferase (adenine-specific)